MPYTPFRHAGSVIRKRKPIQLTFFLTRRCNARCAFCFYISDKNLSKENRPELTIDEIKKIAGSTGNLLWLAFSGGEIFLRDDIVEVTEVFYKRNKPAIILFPTNGLLTDVIREKIEAILKQCRNSTIAVKLSLDGLEEMHDSIRGIKGGFRKTMSTYNVLGELLYKYPNFELGINTVFCSANQDNMDEIIEFVSGLDKIRTHTVSLIRGAVSDKTLKDIDAGKYLETIDKLAANLKKKISGTYRFKGAKLKAAQDILQRRMIYETIMQKRQLIPCYAGRLNVVLTETGEVYPCESFTMNLGNVRDNEYDIKKILKKSENQNIIDSIRDAGCFCTHECYLMTNILFNPRLYPKLLKEYLQL
ncbi:MAG TPA: radical SAM protein [Nitrospirae bacterium]|nr:antilisterial bacteriocin subtilosin biosynthesis protein AlbA [bacterium BMS3Abin06]HDH12780.1 radical SAM protein [Nitrospirota bacterium]HDZ03338.1 radical SAM protein [Nitrospirota bacterium]